jgi:V/A-type H+-transporting ATPase subunit I
MIAKMKYISLSGHISAMNHAVSCYLSRYDIQLEQARHGLMEPFRTLNPYAATLRKAEKFSAIVGAPPILHLPLRSDEAVNIVEAAAVAYDERESRLREPTARLAEAKKQAEALENFASSEIAALDEFEFIHSRLGRLSEKNFLRFEKFFHSDKKIIFIVAKREKDFIYGAFFTPMPHKDEIDALFASLSFEETPAGNIARLRAEISQLEEEIHELTFDAFSQVCSAEKLAIACAKVKNLYAAFDVKKFASISRGRRVFTFSGWITEDDANALEAETAHDDRLLFTRHVYEDSQPPTLLKNLPVIRQFEFFTRLYGLPEYGEIDPTPILAITYTLLFGLMFGDIGHGTTLALIGVFVQRRWHTNLGGIMTVVGVSAAIFGVLYGSIFGFEFRPVWRRPATDITETLLFAAALGAALIVFSMIINMYNCFRQKKFAELFFGANGLAGLLFYFAALWILARIIVFNLPFTPLVAIIAALPLVLICTRSFLSKRGIGNIAIELFETLLTYATNTVSFVRVGAFAVSHAGMMHVVLQLAQGAAASNFLIIISGNALVMLIEGLLVGIQVLRLDFYEIFSRFYRGTGVEFKKTSGVSPPTPPRTF